MNINIQDNTKEIPLRYQISFKESERGLVLMEKN